jgi:preprotein translocase subunit SecA
MRKKTSHNPSPGILYGHYPEKTDTYPTFLVKLKRRLDTFFLVFSSTSAKQYLPFLKNIAIYEANLKNYSEAHLKQRITELRPSLSMHGMTNELLAETFAIIKKTCEHVLGHTPYDTQLIAARIMLDGKLAEMATGEGKTLTAGICVAAAALAGIPVHLITSNDYLVARDSSTLRPLFNALGLTVGAATQGQTADARKTAYNCDITYITAKELVFDYLRDRAIGGKTQSTLHSSVAHLSGHTSNTLLRGLCMAIIDEADSILIDEARVPLILSQSIPQDVQMDYLSKVLELASELIPDQDFLKNNQNLSVEITEAGWQKIDSLKNILGQLKHNKIHLQETLYQALAALHLYQRDKHYLVRNEAVHIIDETTGRIATGRVWSRGLHQLIELKEHCKTTGETVTVAQITYQRFFPKYLRLGGMSGTLNESRAELFSVFGLKVVKVPLRKPSQRIILPTRIYPNRQVLCQAVSNRVTDLYSNGRTILIGTDSVADSEALSQYLHNAGLPHEVLNARQDEREANIIAQAGQPKQITISTNIAGRGTDISLGSGVAELGGIHLISCQHNVSRRIDRQLIGRCARQGNPGSAETLISMDKPLIVNTFPAWVTKLASNSGLVSPQWLVTLIVRLPQILEESHQRAQRYEMMLNDARIQQESSIKD